MAILEGLDLSYKLVDLKFKSKAPDQIYFVTSILVVIVTKGQKRNQN